MAWIRLALGKKEVNFTFSAELVVRQKLMQSTYVVVGALARIEIARSAAVRAQLPAIEGVSVFDLAEPEKLGILVEAPDLNAAHAVLTGPVRAVEGVMGVWPVSVETDGDFGERDAGVDARPETVSSERHDR